jgi:hypothetical protein
VKSEGSEGSEGVKEVKIVSKDAMLASSRLEAIQQGEE